jgi:hypothetical protein
MKLHNYLSLAVALGAPLSALAQTTVLSDTFGSDTLNPASYVNPTSTSTTWDTTGNKTTTTSSISAGNLIQGTVSTGSVTEADALFTTSPITLGSSGQYVQVQYTFTGTSLSASAGYTLVGLFDSNGSKPLTGLTNYATVGGFAGGVTGWTGYNGGLAVASGSSSDKVYARPTQAVATYNQDLLYGGLGTAYGSPVQVGTSNSTKPALADSTQYTVTYKVAYTSPTADTVTYNIYSGVGTGGTDLLTGTEIQSSGNVTTVFDGVSVGFYNKSAASTSIDIQDVIVTTNVSIVPEPATYALLLGVFGLGIAAYRRRSSR